MKIRRMTILGCSLLFASLACDSDTGSNGTGKTDVVQQDTVVADVSGEDVPTSTDTTGGTDVTSTDTGSGDDTVADTGGSGSDTTGGPDTTGEDTAGPDGTGEDVAGPDTTGEDVAGPDGMGEDIQTGDSGTTEDVAVGPDSVDQDTTTTVKAGDPCDEEPWTAICDETTKDVLLICMGEKWNTPQQLDVFACFCDESQGKPIAACAVPGFVGIAKAGRSRTVTTRVRVV